jgi:hypothetical protein
MLSIFILQSKELAPEIISHNSYVILPYLALLYFKVSF